MKNKLNSNIIYVYIVVAFLFVLSLSNVYAIESTTNDNNNNLIKLVPSVEGLEPNFNSSTTKYSLIVSSKTTSLNINTLTEVTGAKYKIEGNENLQMGDNTVKITVTAIDGTEKIYTIIVTRANDPSKANAYLSNIIVDGQKLTPSFTAENFDYEIVDNIKIDELLILAYAQNENSTIEIINNKNFVEGENIIKIIVTAEDSTIKKQYNIKVNKLPEKVANVQTNNETNTTGVSKDLSNNNANIKSENNILSILKQNWIIVILIVICTFEFISIIRLNLKLKKYSNKNK